MSSIADEPTLPAVWVPRPRAISAASRTSDEPKTVEFVAAEYWKHAKSTRATQRQHQTTLRRWDQYLSMLHASDQVSAIRSARPKVRLDQVSEELLADFLRWSLEEAFDADDDNPGRTANKRRSDFHCWFQFACYQRWIDSVPRFPDKCDQTDVAGLFWFRADELDSLYIAADALPDHSRWNQPFRFADAWTAAIVAVVTYGIDTSTIWRKDSDSLPILVRDVSFEPVKDRISSPFGWITYTRQKTRRRFVRPMTASIAAHFNRLCVAGRSPEEPLFGLCYRPMDLFSELVASAKIENASDATGRAHKWCLKDLRKTCATLYESHMPGLAEIILGHSTSQVTRKHYADREPVARKAIMSLPLPESFTRITKQDDSQRLLFS